MYPALEKLLFLWMNLLQFFFFGGDAQDNLHSHPEGEPARLVDGKVVRDGQNQAFGQLKGKLSMAMFDHIVFSPGGGAPPLAIWFHIQKGFSRGKMIQVYWVLRQTKK